MKREKIIRFILLLTMALGLMFATQLTVFADTYTADDLPDEVNEGDVIKMTWGKKTVSQWEVTYYDEKGHKTDGGEKKTGSGKYYVQSIDGYSKYKPTANYQSSKKKVNISLRGISGGDDENETSLNSELDASWEDDEIDVSYGEVDDADSYEVYASYSGDDSSEKAATDNTTKSRRAAAKVSRRTTTIKKLNGKKLQKDKILKIYVVAKKGSKELARSLPLYVAGPKNKFTNAKKIINRKKSIVLEKGKKDILISKLALNNNKKKILPARIVPRLRYKTSDKSVANVSDKGIIKAVGKGKCDIYVFAPSGLAEKVSVRVK